MEFVASVLSKENTTDKRVLEVGSRNINGSAREVANKLLPKEYIGIDIIGGPDVDVVLAAEDVVKTFGENSFDLVICTEMLEHALNWRETISNIKNACKTSGFILVTTRSA